MKNPKSLQIILCVMTSVLATGCQVREDRSKVKAARYEDAMQFIRKEFSSLPDNHSDSVSINQRKLSNENNPEFIIYPGGYKLKYYVIDDSFYYKPFAVQITDQDDNLINHFAFRDEVHYQYDGMEYSIEGDSVLISSGPPNPHYQTTPDLEKNLNALINTLGYQKDPVAIANLIDIIFYHVLRMEKANTCEIKSFVNELHHVSNKDDRFNSALEQYIRISYEGQQVFAAKEGSYGFWLFTTIDNKDGTYSAKATFVGDIFYTSIYL